MHLFGTDGIRGIANIEPITPETIMKVALAAGQLCKIGNHRHTVVIGKDTRLSGYMIEPALTTGFISAGINVVLVGPLPTPAVSMLVRSLRADLGVMISASHNPYQDNGIKFFGPDGYKLSHEVEKKIEQIIKDNTFNKVAHVKDLGKATRVDGADERYIEYIKNTLPKNVNFNGLKIVIDCANGAAYRIAPKVLWELGADVIPVGVSPDGFNINKNVGSTHSNAMCESVIKNDADIGISLDGDADRLVIADENGMVVDGDQILAIISEQWSSSNRLSSNKIIGTLMSNTGLEKYLNGINLDLVRTAVGDKHVCDYMRQNKCNVGGEQSGHIILSDFSCTGDGLLTALHILAILSEKKVKASKLCKVFTPFTQILYNVKITGIDSMESLSVKKKIDEIKKILKHKGRVVVRKSGTEPLIRIMIEGDMSKTVLEGYAKSIEQSIRETEVT